MAYCTNTEVRVITYLTTSDISDADMTSAIAVATKELNGDVNVKVNRERVRHIDNTRKNMIDSSNTVYYIQRWRDHFLADSNDDGDVTIADVIVYQVDTSGTETTLTVSSIDDTLGQITLSTAPTAGVRLYITYDYSPVREKNGNVNTRVNLAARFLAASYAHMKINTGRAPSVSFGSTRISRHMGAANDFRKRYQGVIDRINSLEHVRTGEMVNKI